MIVFGTRPEAIKMAPVVRAVQHSDNLSAHVVVTAQHRHLLDQVLDVLEIEPDVDLDLMTEHQSLAGYTSRAIDQLATCVDEAKPDWVLVHGDTSTAFAGALAAFYHQVPVGHVEAGLRTGNLYSPWPEEANRRLVATLAAQHFAPTPTARDNLLAEGVAAASVHVTGNTVVDSLLWVTGDLLERDEVRARLDDRFAFLDERNPLVLMTNHRRENFGDGMRSILGGVKSIAESRPEVTIVFPTHLNPQARGPAEEVLGGVPNVHLIEPVEYVEFVYLMKRAALLITDSGGVQEEAPSLGVPVLVTRNETERPEAIAAGTAVLVGTDARLLVGEVERVLDSVTRFGSDTAIQNPYGDGTAAQQIVSILEKD